MEQVSCERCPIRARRACIGSRGLCDPGKSRLSPRTEVTMSTSPEFKYGGGIRLGMVFVLQELGMPTRSLLRRFEPFNLHNRRNLEVAVERICAEISYYPQFCS